MSRVPSQNPTLVIRSLQYRDLEAVEQLAEAYEAEFAQSSLVQEKPPGLRRWYGVLKFLRFFPNPFQYHHLYTQVAEYSQRVLGMIQVSPFNRTRSTWRVDRILVADAGSTVVQEPESSASVEEKTLLTPCDVGLQLLRACFETVWEARTWLLEVDVNDKASLALYRQSGFQILARMIYWEIQPELLQELSEREPDLPNLLPVSNADAQLLYQLDTQAMPPLVRQVFDRHLNDFKTSLFSSLLEWLRQWFSHTEMVSGYVFEPQRKAAIGYFQVRLCQDGSQPHLAQLTVHPAYTWLYPELVAQMARIVQDVPAQTLQLSSSDYQPEREEYLERIGASRISHTLMMSRSVWHKLRESKPVSLEGLQLSDVFQGLQPAHKPVPGRISLLKSVKTQVPTEPTPEDISQRLASPPEVTAKKGVRLPKVDFIDPHQQDPCC